MAESTQSGRDVSWTQGGRRHNLSPSFAEALDHSFSGESHFPFDLSVRPDPADARDLQYRPMLIEIPTFKLPPARPGPKVSDPIVVRNQRGEGSCTGQALAAVIDIQNLRRRRQGADVPERVSARMLYSAAQAFDEFPDDELPGSSIRGALKGFWNRGACSDKEMPYLANWRNDALTVSVAKDARRVSLGTYMRLRHVLNDYHCAITEADAIVVSAMVHSGWNPKSVLRNNGVIRMSERPRLQGAHAFAVIGFTPTGFLVLNSWGGGWGGFDLRGHVVNTIKGVLATDKKCATRADLEATEAVLDRAGIGPGGLPGVALWPYEDWQRHVLDAWVLRLAAPTKLPSGITGGYIAARGEQTTESRPASSVRESDIVGHIVHFSGGKLVDRGVYSTPEKSISETAEFLRKDWAGNPKYHHIAVFAHGAFDTRDRVLARAGAMIPVFKRNGIYPIFMVWRSNFNEIIADVVKALLPKAFERAGTRFSEVSDLLLERLSAPIGGALWAQMKKDAKAAFEDGSEVNRACRTLFSALFPDKKQTDGSQVQTRSLHLISLSGGAVPLGEFAGSILEPLMQDAQSGGEQRPPNPLKTISLLAPGCTFDFLDEKLPVAEGVDRTVYMLSEAYEKRPDPGIPGYGKSALWMVSQAFETEPGTPLAGIAQHVAVRGPAGTFVVAAPRSQRCRATRHGDFDNDPYTMNDILRRITGQPDLDDGNGGFRLSEIGMVEAF